MKTRCFLFAAILVLGGVISSPLSAQKNGSVMRPKVLVVNFDPIIRSEGGKRLHEVGKWQDPHYLVEAYRSDLRECSGKTVQYEIKEWQDIDQFPKKQDKFQYSEEEFLKCMKSGKGWHQPDAFDYQAFIREYKLVERVESGEIDEVWVMSMPYSGMWESTMVGDNAYECNSDPVAGIKCKRNFVIMGFNYERGVGEMLEDMGHRTESIMWHVYERWIPKPINTWCKFTLRDKDIPGESGVGSVHFAPNSTKDYEWGARTYVMSYCDDWLDYPNMTGKKRVVTGSDWGNGDIRGHHRWWLNHLPKAEGRGPDGKLANWWKYTVDFNRYPESDGKKKVKLLSN